MGREDRVIFKDCLDYVFNSNEDNTIIVLQYLALKWKETQIGNIHECRKQQIMFSDDMWYLLDKLSKLEDKHDDKKWEESVGI